MVTRPQIDKSQRSTTRVGRALGTLVATAFSACAVSLVALAVLAHTDDAGVSRVAGHPVLTVLSDSMTPTFRAGDLLVDRSVSGPATQLSAGDVITFRRDTSRELITHRIVAVERSGADGVLFRTQGDANNSPDIEAVAPDQVVGVYTHRIPYAGYAIAAARTTPGLVLLVLVPVLILLLPELRRWWRWAGGQGPPPPDPVDAVDSVVTGTSRRGD